MSSAAKNQCLATQEFGETGSAPARLDEEASTFRSMGPRSRFIDTKFITCCSDNHQGTNLPTPPWTNTVMITQLPQRSRTMNKDVSSFKSTGVCVQNLAVMF